MKITNHAYDMSCKIFGSQDLTDRRIRKKGLCGGFVQNNRTRIRSQGAGEISSLKERNFIRREKILVDSIHIARDCFLIGPSLSAKPSPAEALPIAGHPGRNRHFVQHGMRLELPLHGEKIFLNGIAVDIEHDETLLVDAKVLVPYVVELTKHNDRRGNHDNRDNKLKDNKR